MQALSEITPPHAPPHHHPRQDKQIGDGCFATNKPFRLKSNAALEGRWLIYIEAPPTDISNPEHEFFEEICSAQNLTNILHNIYMRYIVLYNKILSGVISTYHDTNV